jgi:signal peptidase II
MKKSILIIFLVLLIDQVIKIWIKTTMFIGEEIPVFGRWFFIHFTENNGMAFGMELEGSYGKLFLSTFRIIAVGAIGWYLYKIHQKETHWGYRICIALIFAGALGNILDSAFYGIFFSDSNYQVAEFLPPYGGYGTFLHGKVVDMFYFPIIEGHFPQWFPIWGSEEFIFFRPVFNFADSSITIGVLLIILFQKFFFGEKKKEELNVEPEQTALEN